MSLLIHPMLKASDAIVCGTNQVYRSCHPVPISNAWSGRGRVCAFAFIEFEIFRLQIKSGTMIVDRKTISIMKACELVGVSRRTIYNWISSGKVEYVRTAGGSVRIFADTLWREPDTDTGHRAWREAPVSQDVQG